MKINCIFSDKNSGIINSGYGFCRIVFCNKIRQLLFQRQRKVGVICSLSVAAILCLLLLKSLQLLHILTFFSALFISTFFCMLSFLRFWPLAQKLRVEREVQNKHENDDLCVSEIYRRIIPQTQSCSRLGIVSVEKDFIFKEDFSTSEQMTANSARIVNNNIRKFNFSFSDSLKSKDAESDSESGDSSAWDQALDSSENGSSSTWHQAGSGKSDAGSIASLKEDNSIWKSETINLDKENAAPYLKFRSNEKKSYTRLSRSTDWDSDDSTLDPYVMLFAEGVSDTEDSELDRQLADQIRQSKPYQNPLRKKASAFCQKIVGKRAASSKGRRHGRKRGLGSICTAVKAFLGRIGRQKIHFLS